MKFVGFETKVNYDRVDPDSLAESICSQDVIRLGLHRHPGGEVRLTKIETVVNQVDTCIE